MIAPNEPIASPASLAQIETLTRRYADARDMLANHVATLNDKIEAIKREAMPDIKRSVARAAEREAELRATIEASPELFIKPRTFIFHGIKVGFQKEKGRIEIPDPDDTIARIKRLFGQAAAHYIRIKESPDKEAIADLPVSQAKQIGCRIVDATDAVVIKPADTDVDRIVTALLDNTTDV